MLGRLGLDQIDSEQPDSRLAMYLMLVADLDLMLIIHLVIHLVTPALNLLDRIVVVLVVVLVEDVRPMVSRSVGLCRRSVVVLDLEALALLEASWFERLVVFAGSLPYSFRLGLARMLDVTRLAVAVAAR